MAGNDIRGRFFRPIGHPEIDPVVIRKIPVTPPPAPIKPPVVVVVPSHLPTTTVVTPPPATTVVPSHTVSVINPIALGHTPLADVLVRVHDHGGQLVDPAIAHVIDQLGGPSSVTPRTQIKLPTLISPTATPTDQTVFEDPGDATKHYSLCGGFQVAVTAGVGGPAKQVELRPEGPNTYVLEVHLERHPIANLTPIPDSIQPNTRCILRATVGPVVREWDFSQVEVNGMQWTLRLVITNTDAATLDAQFRTIYTAMTTPNTDATLIIRRSLSLAVQTTAVRTGPFVPRVATLAMRPIGRPPIDPDDPRPDPLPRPFPHPFPHPPPTTVTGYDIKDIGIDSSVPFAFIREIDTNVFAKLTQVHIGAPVWTSHSVPWQPDPAKPAEDHWYYSDPSTPGKLYFVPDEYRVHRRGDAPFTPLLKASVIDSGKLALTYAAVPFTNDDRVGDATKKLQQEFNLPSPPQLVALRGQQAKLRIDLPNGDSGPGYVEQPNALVQTDTVVSGSVTLTIDEFKQVFDAIVNDTTDLMRGEVNITAGEQTIPVPFAARASDFAGDVLTVQASVKDGLITITAQNAIESPILVNELPIAITQGEAKLDATRTSTAPALPATLNPGDTLTLVYTPSKDVGDITVDADQDSVVVQPNAGAMLDAIVDPATPGHAKRSITVGVAPDLFAQQPGKPRLIQVQVDFPDNHATATFAATGAVDPATGTITSKVDLQLPMREYILGQLSDQSLDYTYQVRLNYADGTSVRGEPQTDHTDQLTALIPSAG